MRVCAEYRAGGFGVGSLPHQPIPGSTALKPPPIPALPLPLPTFSLQHAPPLLAPPGIVDGFRVHVGSEALARRVVAEDEQAWPCRVRLRRARREALEASAAAHDAVELQMPARMQRATRRASEEAAARLEDAVAAAEAEAAAEAAAAGEVEDAAESCATALRPLAGRAPTASTSCLGGACLGLDDATPLAWSRAGSSVLWVLVGSEVVAACELSDAVRTEAAVAVAALGALGVEPIMLTGDCEAKAQAVRAAVGINAARSGAGCKPGG